MAGKDWYFSTAVLGGVGKLFFLKVAQDASQGTGPSRLLGSFVLEGDGGLFGNSEYPVPQNSYILGAVATEMKKLGFPEDQIFDEIGLSGATQQLKIEKTASAGVEAPFPGAPLSAGIGVSYKRIRSVKIEFGAGARKRFIPRDLLIEAYRRFAQKSGDYPPVFFDDDRMVVDQVLLVKELALEVTSDSDFTANFDAKADEMTKAKLGLKYERKSNRVYKLSLDGTREYLFALSAVEADKFVK